MRVEAPGCRVQGAGFRVGGAPALPMASDARLGVRRGLISVEGSGARVQGSGFRVQGLGFRVQGSGFRVQGSGPRAQDSGFRVQGVGFTVKLRVEPLSTEYGTYETVKARFCWAKFVHIDCKLLSLRSKTRKVDIRLSGKGNSNSHAAGPVY